MPSPLFEDPTPEERPFVDSVCDAPADYAPRLVFADWLEERDEPRADWIRASIEVERRREERGFGYVLSSWRVLQPQMFRGDAAMKRCLDYALAQDLPTRDELPMPLVATCDRWSYCGGFIENAAIQAHVWRRRHREIRRRIPLRGVRQELRTVGLGDEDLNASRFVERLEIDCQTAESFGEAMTRRLTDAMPNLRVLVLKYCPWTDRQEWIRCARAFSGLSLETVVFEDCRTLEPAFFEEWQPSGLRCLGFPGCELGDEIAATLAGRSYLSRLRLLDLTRTSFSLSRWDALAASVYLPLDLYVIRSRGTEPRKSKRFRLLTAGRRLWDPIL